MTLIETLFLSVFNPEKITQKIMEEQIIKFGFILIFIRWTYYSVLFSIFRDYQNKWAPFFKPPFGLTVDSYAFWQIRLAIFFGLFLMSMIACGLFVLFRIRDRLSISFFEILNILGFAYFIPFVIIQPLDLMTMGIFGWNPLVIIPLHTVVLIWEAVVTVILIDKIYPVKWIDKWIGVFVQITIWILLCTLFWR